MILGRSIVIAGLLGTALHPATCAGGDDHAAIDAYQQLVASQDRGDVKTAWDRLSAETQQELSRKAQEVAAFRHATAPADGRELAFGEPLMASHRIESVAVTERAPDHASLEVTDDKEGKQIIHVVRERSGWKVDLTSELRQASGR